MKLIETPLPPGENQEQKLYQIVYNNNASDYVTADEMIKVLFNCIQDRERCTPFTVDSRDYHVLENAAKQVIGIPGLVCEIGFRGGGGTRFILEGLLTSQEQRTVIAIDPYGDIKYQGMDGEELTTGSYSNDMMKDAMRYMYDFVFHHPSINFLFFPLEDTEFFKRYRDGVPVYVGKKELINTYALVHFDGPHTFDVVMNETKFFMKRVTPGSIFVYDDVLHFYDHDTVEKLLFKNGFELIEKTKIKASYIYKGK